MRGKGNAQPEQAILQANACGYLCKKRIIGQLERFRCKFAANTERFHAYNSFKTNFLFRLGARGEQVAIFRLRARPKILQTEADGLQCFTERPGATQVGYLHGEVFHGQFPQPGGRKRKGLFVPFRFGLRFGGLLFHESTTKIELAILVDPHVGKAAKEGNLPHPPLSVEKSPDGIGINPKTVEAGKSPAIRAGPGKIADGNDEGERIQPNRPDRNFPAQMVFRQPRTHPLRCQW